MSHIRKLQLRNASSAAALGTFPNCRSRRNVIIVALLVILASWQPFCFSSELVM